MTPVDLEIAKQALAFHHGPEPPVTRFLLAHVPEGGGTEQPGMGRYERTVYDASLSPDMTATSAARRG